MIYPMKAGLCLLVLAAWMVSAAAFAQMPGEADVQLPAGELSDVLAQYSREAGITLSYKNGLLQGKTVPPLSGTYSPEQVLRILLAGSGLRAEAVAEGTWVIRRKPVAVGSDLTLDAIRIQGASQQADAVYQTAGSVSVIEQQDIERFRGSSVGDIFQGSTGVLVGENRNSGGVDVNIRGMQGQGRVPVVVDGARQETTVYRGYSGVSSRTYLDPDLISDIQINKGPVMNAEGAGATGGVVSMRTIGANDIIKPGNDWGVRLRGAAIGNSSSPPPAGTAAGLNGTGRVYRIDCAHPTLCAGDYALPDSFGASDGMNRPSLMDMRSWAGSLAVARRFDHFDLVAAYAQRNQGNYYAGRHGPVPAVEYQYRELPFYTEVTPIREGIARFRGEERVVNSNNRSNTLLLKSNLYLGMEQTLELGYQRYDSEYGELMPSQLIWLDAIRQTENSTVAAHTYTSRYNWDPVEQDWINLSFNLWHTHTRTVNRNYSADLFESDETLGQVLPERYDRIGLDLSNQMQFQGWGRHQISYGVTAQREDIDSDAPRNADGSPSGDYPLGRIGDRTELGVFANWEWQPHPAVTLNAGLRYLNVETEDDKLIVPAGSYEDLYDDEGNIVDTVYVESVFCVDENSDGACDPIRYRTDNHGTAPVFSVAWEPWLNGLQFYARYAEGLRMPSLFEATQGWSVTPALDVSLKPERATNREIGMNFLGQDVWLANDRLALKLAGFHNRTDDYLTRTSPNTWEDGDRFFVMRNLDSVTLHGTELSLEYDAGLAYGKVGGTRYHHIEVCHYGSYRRERCTDYGVANSYFNNMIPPEWHASTTFGVRLFSQRLDLGARITYMGERTPTPAFNDDTARGFNRPVPWHDYRLVDIYASWQPNDTLTVDFNIDNLTDQYYLDALSLGMVPAPGRTARLGLTLNY